MIRILINLEELQKTIIVHDLHSGFGLKLPVVQRVELPIRAVFHHLVLPFRLQGAEPTKND